MNNETKVCPTCGGSGNVSSGMQMLTPSQEDAEALWAQSLRKGNQSRETHWANKIRRAEQVAQQRGLSESQRQLTLDAVNREREAAQRNWYQQQGYATPWLQDENPQTKLNAQPLQRRASVQSPQRVYGYNL